MKKKQQAEEESPYTFERLQPDCHTGLTASQAKTRMEAGAHNTTPRGVTASVGKIVLKNVVTPFNIINLCLAVAILLVGSPRNTLFFGIALCNTIMGIVQELRAKKTLDKLSILARGTVTVVRDGAALSLPQEEVVLDDIMLVQTGNQVSADAVVIESDGLETDESLLTGEADHIRKPAGSEVLSGSFVVAGQARTRVVAVGQNSYAGKLSVQAKKEKRQIAPLIRTLNNIIRVLAIAIIPIGLSLFFTQYNTSGDLNGSVVGAAAAMVGMIPEGLILLTGITLTLGAVKLARRKALVQALPSIETLARADILCLDKTGTITDGTLSFEGVEPMNEADEAAIHKALAEMVAVLPDDNATARALRARFAGQPAWVAAGHVPFSSARKWSAASFEGQGSYVLGAPGFVFPGDEALIEAVKPHAAKGFRVLALAHSPGPMPKQGLPQDLACLGLVVLSDTIRAEAPDTFAFFEAEGVTLKVISGDDALTVSTIAQKAGITRADQYVDMSALKKVADFGALVKHFTVFGRVSPEQKRQLVKALKDQDHTVCMTGDGVNDVLAMKESDCGVAMIGGSDAARGAADFVLMTSDFSAMVDVLREGRRVINNIENVASLYLVKTIYSTILSLLYVFIPYPYPFEPTQMTPINGLTVGIPSFFLALRPEYDNPKGRFLANILESAVPAALTVVFNILVVQVIGIAFSLTELEISTMNILLTGWVGFCLLFRVAKPLRAAEITILSVLVVLFLGAFFVMGDFFNLGSPLTRNVFFYLPLMYIIPRMMNFLTSSVQRVKNYFTEMREEQARLASGD